MTRVLWNWGTMGPYHFPRMRELAKRSGVDLLVVERSSRDDHYWERAEKAKFFELVTLSTEPLGQEGRHILAQYGRILQRFQPDVICINGYSDPAASPSFEFAKRNPNCFALLWSETTAFDQKRQWWRECVKSYLLGGCDGKNLQTLLRAFQKYRKRNGPWSLVLVGTGEEESQLRQVAAAQDTCAIHFAGVKQLPELVKYYAFASCFVLPSISEPWGLVVNEAMASGLPMLVSNRCGCATDLVEEGANGFLFDPEDTEAIADVMARISSGRVDLVKVGERSRERIAAFNPSEFARGTVQHIDFLRGTLGKFQRRGLKISWPSYVAASVTKANGQLKENR